MPAVRTIVVATVLFTSVPLISQAQSLGDIAKKAAADKAAKAEAGTAQSPPRVLTNRDLVSDPLEHALPAAKLPAAPAVWKDAGGHVTSAPVKDEHYWRARMVPLVARTANDVGFADMASRNLSAMRARVRNPASVAVVSPEVVQLTEELKYWNAVVAADRVAIESLKEEGRQAGALPGWFR